MATFQSKSEEAKIVEKNEKVILYYALLFAKPQYDKNGAIVTLLPGDISDEVMEVLSSLSSVSEQARLLSDIFRVLSEDISKERTYLSRAACFPFLSETTYKFMLQHYYHADPIDRDNESIKKSFNILSLLPPPLNRDDEYENTSTPAVIPRQTIFLTSHQRNELALRNIFFIRGRQETFEDVISFVRNITVFARFWSKIPANQTS